MKHIKIVGLLIIAVLLTSASVSNSKLEKKLLLNDRIELKIPKEFTIMGEELVKLKYPLESRPNLIYTNETGGINVAFSLTNSKANQEGIASYKDYLVKTFEDAYPSAKWIGNGVKIINGRKVGCLELITPAIDTKIYNKMFFTDLDGKLLICTFNCTEKSLAEWKPVANEIMYSLTVK